MRNVISTNLACNVCVHDQAKSSYHVYAHKSLKFKNIFKTYRWGLSFFEVFILGMVLNRLSKWGRGDTHNYSKKWEMHAPFDLKSKPMDDAANGRKMGWSVSCSRVSRSLSNVKFNVLYVVAFSEMRVFQTEWLSRIIGNLVNFTSS